MKFAFIPRAAYEIGQTIELHGAPMRIESFTHSGRNFVAVTLNAPLFERVLCIRTDSPTIEGVTK